MMDYHSLGLRIPMKMITRSGEIDHRAERSDAGKGSTTKIVLMFSTSLLNRNPHADNT